MRVVSAAGVQERLLTGAARTRSRGYKIKKENKQFKRKNTRKEDRTGLEIKKRL